MSKTIVYIAASLDGFIARQNGAVDWLDAYQNADEDYGYVEFYASVGAVVMGWNTYEKSLTLPGALDPNMPTYVVSSMVPQQKSETLHFVSGENLTTLMREIQQSVEKDIWIVGGGKLVQSLMRLDLIDEIILSTIPIVLGNGISLFGSVKKEFRFSILSSKSYSDGIVQSHYRLQRELSS